MPKGFAVSVGRFVLCVFCLLRTLLTPVAKDSIAGIIAVPSSVADRTANIEKTCDFLKEKGVTLPPDIVKGTVSDTMYCVHFESDCVYMSIMWSSFYVCRCFYYFYFFNYWLLMCLRSVLQNKSSTYVGTEVTYMHKFNIF